ncbi:MAG: WD40 repeat domain-containing protein, partial [Bacteroidetes bacterium]|nr:WD40 repeat domain-containing protein [Bacteroidota bacterium]
MRTVRCSRINFMPWIFLLLITGRMAAQDVLTSPYASLQTPGREDITAFAFSSDGNTIAIGDDDGKILVWSVVNKRPLVTLETPEAVIFLSFLSENKDVVAVDAKGTVSLLNLLKSDARSTFRTRGTPIRATIDAGKQMLAIATDDELIEFYDLKASMPAGTANAADVTDHLLFLGFDRPGQQLAAITERGAVVVWNPNTFRRIRDVTLQSGELAGSGNAVHSAATNRSANVLVVGLEEVAIPKGGIRSGANPNDLLRQNFVIAYDWSSGTEIKRIKVPTTVEAMAMGPGNDHVATVPDEGNEISFVDLRKGEIGGTVTATERPRIVAISEDNRWLAVGS